MPRSYGITNIAPYAAAPAVGPAGDTYYNTGNKSLYISDGAVWNQIQASGGGTGPTGPAGPPGAAYVDVAATAPPPATPTINPPNGLLWVDTSTTPSWVPYQIPGPTGPTGPAGPAGVDFDGGNQTNVDNNTLTRAGVYIGTDGNGNAPPIPPGQYVLEVRAVAGNSVIEQQATHINQPNYIATRMYVSGAWAGWKSPPAGMLWTGTGPATSYSGTSANLWTPAPGVPLIAGRRYRQSWWFTMTNSSGAAESFCYFTATSSNNETPNNSRVFWSGGSTNTGQSNYFTGSYVWQSAVSNTPTWIMGCNGSGSFTVNANAWTLTIEDVGY